MFTNLKVLTLAKLKKKRKEEIIRCAKKLVNKVSSNITEILLYSLYTQFYIIRLFKKREKTLKNNYYKIDQK